MQAHYYFWIIFCFLSVPLVLSMESGIKPKDAQKILNELSLDLQEEIVSAPGSAMHLLEYTGKKRKYTFSLGLQDVVQYGYYPNHREYLKAPATLNTCDLVNDFKKKSSCRLANPNEKNVFFNLQCWPGGMNKSSYTIRFDNTLRNLTVRFTVFEHLVNANPTIFFDGPNQSGFTLMCINSVSDRYKRYRFYMFRMYKSASYVATQAIEEKNHHVTSLMLHNYDNKIAYCFSNIQTGEATFNLGNILQISPKYQNYDLEIVAKAGLACALINIGRLNDRMYLALGENGRLQLISLDEDNTVLVQEKRVFYQTGSYQVTQLLEKARHKKVFFDGISIHKGGEVYTKRKEDFFTHLAVDNCTDGFGKKKSHKRDAVAFVVINKARDVLYANLKKPFYNQDGQITLRKLNIGTALTGSVIDKVWLAGNMIMLQGKQDGIEYVKTAQVRCVLHKVANHANKSE